MNKPNDYRQRIYERYASTFKGAAGAFDQAAARRAGRAMGYYLRGWLPEDLDTPILDVGCGGGNLLYLFKTLGYRAIRGVDISDEQAALARQVVLDVATGEAVDYLRHRPGEFGLITAIDLIEHLGKDEVLDFLDAVYVALRPGGRVIVQTPNAWSPRSSTIRYGDFTHEVCFTPGVLGRIMALCGFAEYQAREQGPIPQGVKSAVRWALWRIIRFRMAMLDMIETGSAGDGIYSRVFMATAQKGTHGRTA